MFNLEAAITEWRQRMLAGGITAPTPMEELESHLREEIERFVDSGLDPQTAFNSAICDLGNARVLKAEFARAGGFWGWLGADTTTRIYRILGILWLTQNLWYLGHTVRAIAHNFFPDTSKVILLVIVITFIVLQELGGIIGGVLLIRGARWGCRIVRILAMIDVIPMACILCESSWHRTASWGDFVNVLFDVITIWLLRPVKKTTLATK